MTAHLPGLEPPVTLTERQSLALQILRAHGPLDGRELGRLLREQRGIGTERYDEDNGVKVAKELRAKGLAKRPRAGWVAVGYERRRVEGYDPASAGIPF